MEEAEYKKSRTVSEFLEWVKLVNNSRTPEQSKLYRARSGYWKKFADEAEPVACLIEKRGMVPMNAQVLLDTTFSKSDVQLVWPEGILRIQVTTTDNVSAVHNRLQLNEFGAGPGQMGNVQSSKALATFKNNKIRDEGRHINPHWLRQQEIQRMCERIIEKGRKSYPEDTLLLVDSCDSMVLELENSQISSMLASAVPQADIFSEIWVNIFRQRSIRLK